MWCAVQKAVRLCAVLCCAVLCCAVLYAGCCSAVLWYWCSVFRRAVRGTVVVFISRKMFFFFFRHDFCFQYPLRSVTFPGKRKWVCFLSPRPLLRYSYSTGGSGLRARLPLRVPADTRPLHPRCHRSGDGLLLEAQGRSHPPHDRGQAAACGPAGLAGPAHAPDRAAREGGRRQP